MEILKIIGGLSAFVAMHKATEAAFNKQFKVLAWLAPLAIVLWVTCVGLELRYFILLALVIIGTLISAWVTRRKTARQQVASEGGES